ncbi:uncharacterized protein DNG_04041 [Cephalotrichum gorgonifer]|uniref:Uncharacterized protein n=1 Tax=Cephalotrichum gorgonifer TaxID=2041049 RepID=A0AAE8MX84_9PEZI|nr:uncharacterized protein DNG_04041 [Cephalotrichum gorgonifer]
MFGFHIPTADILRVKVDPKDVPPPTPVVFPAPHKPGPGSGGASAEQQKLTSLVETLQRVYRPNDIKPQVFDTLRLKTYYDANPVEIIPDPTYLPDFASWSRLSAEEARELNQATRIPLNNGNLSPGCQVYFDRRAELSNPNEDAFRTVRRQPPQQGRRQPRLGNSYEFFRCLELMTPYWDDPTAPPQPPPAEDNPEPGPASDSEPSTANGPAAEESDIRYRTMAGTQMPAEVRHNVLSAFIKLVAYDFGCNVTTPRVEPRLNLTTPPSPGGASRKSYVPSGCIFVFRTPMKKEQARGGFTEGPVAAVTARASVGFDDPLETNQDLAREVLAALVTAQHRYREGKEEKRFGEGQWWTTRPRWGGGSGGPIGREIDRDEVVGDKDGSSPPTKKPRKTISAYDNYRMVRPPALTWDRKTKYEAIGSVPGAGYDDVFVISCIFHHVSVLRVRVPKGLLRALEGNVDEEFGGDLVFWRSKWYDLFVTEERIAAVELLWGVFAYQMRTQGEEKPGS